MTDKDLDKLARGPNPHERVAVPVEGERCPRCHQRVVKGHSRPCLLCAPHLVPMISPEKALHLASVTIDYESIARGGTTRQAICTCGWLGPQRGTLELAVDDALEHEKASR